MKQQWIWANVADHCIGILLQWLLGYPPGHPEQLCMAGFVLKNTLSDHGGVPRGIYRMNESGYLTDVVETHDILKTE